MSEKKMKQQKIKRYRLSVSRTFQMTHPRKGEDTNFTYKIFSALGEYDDSISKSIGVDKINPKLHTIRGNYQLWGKRMAEVQAGRAVIELFYWDGKPYRSSQVVFATLDKDSGCGLQILKFSSISLCERKETPLSASIFGADGYPVAIGTKTDLSEISKNDGLKLQDFKDWFKGYDLSQLMAIIHFTKFRY